MKTMRLKLGAAILAVCLPLAAFAGEGVTVDFLSPNNTLVRVDGSGKYLLIPVEDNNDEATVNLLVNNKQEQTMIIRLAKNKIDYYVPLDLSRYAGKNVILNVVTNQGRSSVREAKQDVCWNNFTVSDSFDTTNTEKYRPKYHHTPLYGWMNDPNGMFYKDGIWHLYYQWNPYGSKWQNMTWGHSTSKDLINWEHKGTAIEPNGLGAVFSGSSAIDKNNTAGFGKDAVVAMYTSAAASQIQSLAWSTDNGETFEIYDKNPVIILESEARDPNFFYNEKTGKWNLALAHALDHEVILYSSDDMKHWKLESSFGKVGAQDGVWECPDLFELQMPDGKSSKWVMLVNLNPGGPFGGSGVQYFTGEFDGKTFKPDMTANGEIELKWLDYGKDNYATVSWSDAPEGRRTLLGWMSNWQYAAQVPTLQYRSANTLPRDVELFTGTDGNTYVASKPSKEIYSFRGKAMKSGKSGLGKKGKSYKLPTDGICEIDVELEGGAKSDIELELSNAKGEKCKMVYNAEEETFSFDRRESGITDFSADFPCETKAPTFGQDGKLSLRIFIDSSSVEIFGNDGKFSMTNLVFPTEPYTELKVKALEGKGSVKSLAVYPLKAAK